MIFRHTRNRAANSFALVVICAAAGCSDPRHRDEKLLDTGGPLSAAQLAYDVDRYVLNQEIFPERKSIAGESTIEFTATAPLSVLELDFDGTFKIASVTSGGAPASYKSDERKIFVTLPKPLAKGEAGAVTVVYAGKPIRALRAPWDGGFVWAKTPSGKPWIATAIQGEGCDVWFPCKDHPLGEPRKGFELSFTVPAGLTAVSNGVLEGVDTLPDGRRKFRWRTKESTNIYGVALNVGPYTVLRSKYKSVNGVDFPVEFWPLEERKDKGKILFDSEFAKIIEFYERHLGPYPWSDEKMGVVETPHLGMEHQTINAYGAKYRRGDSGFDWLLHHEFAHEWFGNFMSISNNADMWLHEGTAAYMQPVYAQELIGDAVFAASMYKSYLSIRNCAAVAPRAELTEEQVYENDKGGPGGDIYTKGAWALHSLRYLVGDEAFWRSLRRLVYDTPEPSGLKPPFTARFRTTDDFLALVNAETGQDLAWFFEVYLRRAPLPALTQTTAGNDVLLKWKTPDDLPFPMPIPVRINGEIKRIEMPGGEALLVGAAKSKVEIDPMLSVLRLLPSSPSCEERKALEAEGKADKKAAFLKDAASILFSH